MTITVKHEIDINFSSIHCSGCGILYFVPKAWVDDRRESGKEFSCPNECIRVFSKSLSKELQEKVDILETRVSLLNRAKNEFEAENLLLKSRQKKANKLKCPHCLKSYKHLESHIRNKHKS